MEDEIVAYKSQYGTRKKGRETEHLHVIVNIKYVRKRRELASLLAEYEYTLLRITEWVLDAATKLTVFIF